jgi:hypothetical protein
MGIEIIPSGAPQSSVGGVTGTIPVNLVQATPASATAAANTQVTLTIAQITLEAIRINSLSFGFSGAVGTGLATIVVNSVTIWQGLIDVEGITPIPLPEGGIECANNFSCTITLPAGGAGAIGFINASYFYGN